MDRLRCPPEYNFFIFFTVASQKNMTELAFLTFSHASKRSASQLGSYAKQAVVSLLAAKDAQVHFRTNAH